MTPCQKVHDRFQALPRFSIGYDVYTVPKNGIYAVFEAGELAHAGDRIVRIGTHTGSNNLQARLNEHLYASNKDRSIFRKHIGRSLLARRADPFYSHWNLDLTTRANREKFGHLIDMTRLQEIEAEVTAYIIKNLSFAVIEVGADRISAEGKLLSTLYYCPLCGPSDKWLGRAHPKRIIAESGLWNVQGMRGTGLSLDEARRL